jgi:hypothetical protein
MARKKATKKVSAKKSKAKKGKAKELSQAHGKVENFQPTSLDQIWGDDGTSKYRTMDEHEYATQLADMSRTDLHAHASQIGLIPVENADQLKKRLVAEFKKHVAQYRMPAAQKKPPLKVSKEARKILEEGR